jgi:hypothetical protein
MGKKATALTLMLTLLFSALAGTLITNSVSAQMGPIMNSGPRFDPLLFKVTSPIRNQVYNNSAIIQLNITITKPEVMVYLWR